MYWRFHDPATSSRQWYCLLEICLQDEVRTTTHPITTKFGNYLRSHVYYLITECKYWWYRRLYFNIHAFRVMHWTIRGSINAQTLVSLQIGCMPVSIQIPFMESKYRDEDLKITDEEMSPFLKSLALRICTHMYNASLSFEVYSDPLILFCITYFPWMCYMNDFILDKVKDHQKISSAILNRFRT